MPPGGTGNYSRDQLIALAQSVGFKGDDAKIAAAVAMAESGGNPRAHNTKAPDNSYGLWQINMYGNLGPDRRKRFGLPNNDILFDPRRNAMVAKHIKDGSGWGAWTTYTTGKYKQHMDGGGFVEGVKDGISEVTGIGQLGESVNALGKNIFNGLASLTGVVVAISLFSVGVLILLRNQIPVKKLTKLAAVKGKK